MLAQLLPLFIAAIMLTALSCALWLVGLGLYFWLLSLLSMRELMVVDSGTIGQKNSPELNQG